MRRIDLNGELILLGSEGHVLECPVQLVDLAPNEEQVFPQPEHDVFSKLLQRLLFGLADSLEVARQPALAPDFELGGELVESRAFDGGNQPAPFDIPGLEDDEMLDQVLHPALDVLPLPAEDVPNLIGRP